MFTSTLQEKIASLLTGSFRSTQPRRLKPAQEARLWRASSAEVQALEERRLFASFSVSGTVLTVTGTSSAESYNVFKETLNGFGVRVVTGGTTQTSAQSSSYTRIDIYAGGGNDTIFVENSDVNPVGDTTANIATKLFGEDGADVITGGENRDTVDGGPGNDVIDGFKDDDLLYGGYGGNDSITGGLGNDIMYGADLGYGATTEGSDNSDTIDGGEGSDTGYGQDGNDSMSGGWGADLMFGGAGYDDLRGDGIDSFDGATDTLDGGADSDTASDDDGDVLVSIETIT